MTEFKHVRARMLNLLEKYPEHRDKNARFWVFLYWREYEDIAGTFSKALYVLGAERIQYQLTDPDTILRMKRDIQNREGKFVQSKELKLTKLKREMENYDYWTKQKDRE